uniref:Uncharacterized protein n=1 Tax=Arundo donax TaxID=35708 RepID=A0A0A9EGQ8_ARUDO
MTTFQFPGKRRQARSRYLHELLIVVPCEFYRISVRETEVLKFGL